MIEIGGGVLYLFPRTNLVGAALLAATMLGATIAHFTVLQDPMAAIITLPLLGLSWGLRCASPRSQCTVE